MKYLIKIVSCTVLGAVLGTACNKDSLTNLNINEQAVNEISLNFVLTSAQLGTASAGSAGDDRYTDWRTNIGFTAYAIQQLADDGNNGGIAPGDRYTDNPESSEAPWEFIYGDQLKNIALILRESGPGGFGEGEYPNTRPAARLIKAFLFQRLTDYYGSIPYSEALQAPEGIFFPNYDKQRAVYTDLLKEVDEATAEFSTADDPDFAAADLYYKGDIAKWKKWGYSLMLRMAMRLSVVDKATADTYVAKAVAGGVFTSNADNLIVPQAIGPSQWTNQNGISRAFYPGDGGQPTFLSKPMIDWLKGTNQGSVADDDPRLMIFTAGIGSWTVVAGVSTWTPTSTGTDPLKQKGMPNGHDLAQLKTIEGNPNLNVHTTYSKINPKLLDLDDPYMLMNYGEVELLLAEAAQSGIGGLTAATAAAHYAAGVKASMKMYVIYDPSLIVTDAQVDAYLASYPYTGGNGLKMIGEQYWANHYLNWWEAWSNWRRTKFPVLTPTNFPGNLTNGTIPERLKYPVAEVGGNPNYAAGATAPNEFTTKVWWAGGPE